MEQTPAQGYAVEALARSDSVARRGFRDDAREFLRRPNGREGKRRKHVVYRWREITEWAVGIDRTGCAGRPNTMTCIGCCLTAHRE